MRLPDPHRQGPYQLPLESASTSAAAGEQMHLVVLVRLQGIGRPPHSAGPEGLVATIAETLAADGEVGDGIAQVRFGRVGVRCRWRSGDRDSHVPAHRRSLRVKAPNESPCQGRKRGWRGGSVAGRGSAATLNRRPPAGRVSYEGCIEEGRNRGRPVLPRPVPAPRAAGSAEGPGPRCQAGRGELQIRSRRRAWPR